MLAGARLLQRAYRVQRQGAWIDGGAYKDLLAVGPDCYSAPTEFSVKDPTNWGGQSGRSATAMLTMPRPATAAPPKASS